MVINFFQPLAFCFSAYYIYPCFDKDGKTISLKAQIFLCKEKKYKILKTKAEIIENIKSSGMPLLKISKENGVPNSTLDKWVRGVSKPDLEVLLKIDEFLSNKENSKSLKFAGSTLNANAIPVFSEINPASTNDSGSKNKVPMAFLPNSMFPNCDHAQRVSGNSMYPRIINQGYVIGKVLDKTKSIASGEIYGIHFNSQSLIRYLHDCTDTEFMLRGESQSAPEFKISRADVDMIFRVLFILNPA
jgi:SOS-response transcriptional repressor LexA